MPKPKTLAQRFWEKVQRGDPDECWLWLAAVNQDGYGVIRLPHDGDLVYAHRLSYAFAEGPIPEGMVIRHLCDKRYAARDITYRRCVNRRHLEPGTQSENMQDMWDADRGRCPKRFGGEPKQLVIELA